MDVSQIGFFLLPLPSEMFTFAGAKQFRCRYKYPMSGIAVSAEYIAAFRREGVLDIRTIQETGWKHVCTITIEDPITCIMFLNFFSPHCAPYLLAATNAEEREFCSTISAIDITARKRVAHIISFDLDQVVNCMTSCGSSIAVALRVQRTPYMTRIDLFQGTGLHWVRVRSIPYCSPTQMISWLSFTSGGSRLVAFEDSYWAISEIGVRDDYYVRQNSSPLASAPLSVPYRDGWLLHGYDDDDALEYATGIDDFSPHAAVAAGDSSHAAELSRTKHDMAYCPGLGVLLLLNGRRLHLYMETDAARMRAMAPVRVAWMCAVVRRLM